MTVLVTDSGFSAAGRLPSGQAGLAVELAPDADPATLGNRLDAIDLIRVKFPDFADGRGFTIARVLRLMGFRGRLRACGHVIADQYAMARRAGFDEVEIDDELAARQPEGQWLRRADWRSRDYQARLRAKGRLLRKAQSLVRDADATGARDMTDEMAVTASGTSAATLPDAQAVTHVRHWTDRLFSFRVTRPPSLRFRSGEFVMLGLMGDNGKPLLRAYSIASPAWDDELEFYSIKVPDGPLTSRLQHVREGEHIILRTKPVGTLVLDALLPGDRLWLFATGTGIAPFASLARDPETFERYGEVILMHTCRDMAELGYGRELVEGVRADGVLAELVGEGFADRLRYYPSTTRERGPTMGRITDNLMTGKALADLAVDRISPERDRGMVCGSFEFIKDMKAVLEGFGLEEGANSDPGHYVVEKAFVGDGI